MKRIRVLVVDDSLTVRKRLVEILSKRSEFEVVGEAADGKTAIELCRELRPDVITLDMMLPVMTGVAATEYIMAYFPTPILIVSASTNRGELFRTYDALSAGAVDVLDKPTGDEPADDWEERFVDAVKMVSRIPVITHPRGRLAPTSGIPVAGPRAPAPVTSAFRLLAIGASTGGPSALVQILRDLPSPFPVPIAIVLHIADRFGEAFAGWLDGQTLHRVQYATNGESVAAAPGLVVMAPPGRHLSVAARRLKVEKGPERHSCCPSVDVLFESVAADYGAAAIGCLLTGMGKDGALGLLQMKRHGAATIAQDEATSTVYGMPREAARLGAVDQVLPLPDIGAAVCRLVGVGSAP